MAGNISAEGPNNINGAADRAKAAVRDDSGRFVKKVDADKNNLPDKHSAKSAAPGFTKIQILSSKRYGGKRDILQALLDEDCIYTHAEIDEKINKFMEGKVK